MKGNKNSTKSLVELKKQYEVVDEETKKSIFGGKKKNTDQFDSPNLGPSTEIMPQ